MMKIRTATCVNTAPSLVGSANARTITRFAIVTRQLACATGERGKIGTHTCVSTAPSLVGSARDKEMCPDDFGRH